MEERDPRAPALLLILGCTWGASFLFIKVIVEDVSPVELVAGRLFFGALSVLAFIVVTKHEFRWTPGIPQKMAVQAVASNIIPFWLISWGEQHIDSGTASVLNSTVPIFTAVFAAMFLLEERFTAGRLVGLLLGFAGIIVLTGDDALRITDSDVLGQLAVVGAAVCYGAAAVYSRTLLRQNDPVTLSALQLMLGTVFCVPLVIALEGAPAYGALGLDAWGSLLALGLGGTGLAYIVYLWLIEHTGSVRASLVTYIVPVIALFLGWAVLDESLGVNVIAGAALIVFGVATVMRGQGPARVRKLEPAVAVGSRGES
ncbi:MAG TPA: DMT family transporter [Dehalococcoidia bacterium]|nr:DMT family transporter [Dehalococcoidia bacterium]